jgi:mono/diheme cytochrome c family protein
MKEGPERIDYQETPDVTEVHAAVKREHAEPTAEVTPMPLWLTALCGVAVAWAGFYFGVFNGGLSSNIYNEYESSPGNIPMLALPQKEGVSDAISLTLAQQGKSVYGQCVGCHGGTGLGVPGQFPPLAGSPFVIKGEKRIVAILLKGLTGPLTVEGKQFNNAMPPWEAALTPRKIAAVASFVRQEWGNKAGEISEAKVVAAKKEFASKAGSWTEAELLQIPEDAVFPDEGGAAPAPGAPGTPAAPTAAATAPAAAPAPSASPAASAAPSAAPALAPAAGSFDLKGSITRGQPLYMQTCIACHQPTGMGLPGAFPPLAKTDYTTGDARRMVAMILKGVQGPLTVNGVQYNNIMLPLDMQFPVLKDDAKVADVVNYVRNSFGNVAKDAVTPELVTAVRKEFESRTTPWTEADLKAFPAAPNK